jgi:uncharacterized repeat protein (TIGR01451 family)
VYNSGTGLWSVGSVASGSNATLTIDARVLSSSEQTNTATISHSDQFDPNPGNNTASVTEGPQQADLALAKTVSNPTPNVGDTVTFTVTLTNIGPDAATGVTVTDLLPPGLNLIGETPSQGSYDPVTGVWTVGTVTPGAPQTLQFQALVVSPNPQTNTATVSHSDQFDPDPNNNQASATATPQQADLALAKTVSDPTPNVGDVITYSVTLTNNGPNAATDVAVTDPLPAGLAFVSATPSLGTYNSAAGLWTVGTVPASTPETLTVQARVVSPDAQTNTATVSHSDQFDPNPGNNSAAATETPQQADVAVSKTVSDPTPNVGDTITYTITVSNNGPNDATNVVVMDDLPPQVRFVTSVRSNPSAGTYDPTTHLWSVGTVVAGTSETLTITALVVSPDVLANTATITHSDQFDPNPGNNSSTTAINPLEADLALAKTVSDPTPNVGDTITFTVTLTNNGPSEATNVTVSDPLPAGLSLVTATPSLGTYDSTTGLWTVGTVTAAAQETLQFQATVVSPNAQTNIAAVARADQFDPDPGNNQASATATPQQADLALTKTVSNPTPNVGDTITYTVTLNDLGPNPATNVTVDDLLPAGLTLLTATPSAGTYGGGVWTVGTVDPSRAETLTLTARVDSPSPQTNTATIGHSDQFDPDTTNNTASATATPQQADLVMSKAVSNATPNVGGTIIYTVTVSNIGPDAATNVSVTDLLPAGLTFVSANPSQGAYNSATGLWTVNTLSPTTTATLQIQATVVSPDPQTNTATVTHSDQFDPDTANNSASTTETPQQADLAVTKTVSDPTPNVGDTITFTVTVSNNGPDSATNVAIDDVLPAGLDFVASTPSQGIYNSAIGVWSVGTVGAGASQTLQIRARVVSPSAQTNTATIGHADQFDPNTSNNTGSATETPQQADLAVTKSVSDPTPNVGDTITYTVTLSDLGPDAATNVTVLDPLPSGLTFVASTPSQGSYNSLTGLWTVGTVSTTTPLTLQIQATVVSPNPSTNTATINHADQFDPDLANNTSSATATPQVADLAVTKTVSNPTPNVGDTVTFTVTLTNNGPAAASGVDLTDLLPAGLSLISANLNQGTFVAGTGVADVGSLAQGATVNLTLTVRVVSNLPRTNTATVTHADQFDPNLGNNSAGATVAPLQSDLALTKTASTPTPPHEGTVTFTVSLTNFGPGTATDVTVADALPSGLSLVSAAPSQGSYANGVWDVGTVPVSTVPTLTITALVVSLAAETNTATISHADQFDPDPNDNTASATVTPEPTADLGVTKTISNPAPNFGETVTYTVTVTNNGPDTATGVTVSDPVPAGMTFVSAAPDQGSFDPATGIWTIGTMANGTVLRLFVNATVDSFSPLTNTATVTAAQFDPDLSNNRSSITETPQPALSSIAGSVYFDSNDNGIRDPGELGIPGVTVTLTSADPVFATVVTDANGHYLFRNMLPGTYTLTETPPPGTIDGRDRMGSLGGVLAPDSITDIPVGPNQNGINYDFAVIGLSDPSKFWLLASSSNFLSLFGPPGSGVTDVNPGPDPPARPFVAAPALVVFPSPMGTAVAEFLPGAASPSVVLVPFPGYFGPLSTAVGDVMGTGHPDIVVATATITNAVQVYDGVTGALVDAFFAFPGAPVGASVAVGDVTGTGQADIVVGTATGASGVRVFDPRTGQVLSSFLAFPGFTGGIQVAVGDEEGTGTDEIAVTPQGVAFVAVYDESGAWIRTIMPFGPAYTGDLSVAFGAATSGPAPLFIGTATGGALVSSFVAGVAQGSFVAFPNFAGGVQVAAGDVDGTGQSEVVVRAVGTNLVGIYQSGAAIDEFVGLPLPADDLTASLLWLARTQGF